MAFVRVNCVAVIPMLADLHVTCPTQLRLTSCSR
jgi:hypothetical protein